MDAGFSPCDDGERQGESTTYDKMCMQIGIAGVVQAVDEQAAMAVQKPSRGRAGRTGAATGKMQRPPHEPRRLCWASRRRARVRLLDACTVRLQLDGGANAANTQRQAQTTHDGSTTKR
jgi:hypothetical protein